MSTPSVNPKNWKTGGQTLLKKDWQIQYYFYDPEFQEKYKYGKLIAVKGMNSYKILAERRAVTKVLIENEVEINKKGFNPFLKRFVVDTSLSENELHPDLPFISAFELALQKIKCTKKHKNEIRWAIERLEKRSIKMHYSDITIGQLKRSELKKLLESCKLPDYYFNKIRGYLSTLFGELIEYECCETNLTRDIRKRKVVVKKREILNADHFKIVMDYLEKNYYEFWRYSKIFLYAGSRTTELFSLQAKNVDLANQEYMVTIKKGKQHKEVTKVILKEVLPLWKELMKKTKPNYFLFAKNLVPGKESILACQITKRWYRLVKTSDAIKDQEGNVIKITADFYALKHSFLDSLPTDKAQMIASHTNSKTTSIYQVNQDKRNREILKGMDLDSIY
jgi:integrase